MLKLMKEHGVSAGDKETWTAYEGRKDKQQY